MVPADAGTYWVKAAVAATTNYLTGESAAVSFTINKAAITPVVSVSAVTYPASPNPSVSSGSSQMLVLNTADATVNISGVHFKDGRATGYGAAIWINAGAVNLESCIFSGNQTTSIGAYGGAIYKAGSQTLTVKGCTFYGNSSGTYGGAIYNSNGTLTLTGNLFYGNTAANTGPVVYRSGTVTSGGYNVVDVTYDAANSATTSGFAAATGDTTFSALGITDDPVNPSTFVSVSGLSAVLPATAPAGFPLTDFKGVTRTFPGAPGAVK
jgi:predicted outer membrane repeat protein